MTFVNNKTMGIVIKGFVIFMIPPTILNLIDLMVFLFPSTFLYVMLRDALVFGVAGILLTSIYEYVIKKLTKFHKIVAKIGIGLYYLVFLIQLIVSLYFIFVIGNLTPN